jgi:hypothetical protein
MPPSGKTGSTASKICSKEWSNDETPVEALFVVVERDVPYPPEKVCVRSRSRT